MRSFTPFRMTFHEILHGVYPETRTETLRFAQGDRWRRVQNDIHGIPLIVTQSLEGEGRMGGITISWSQKNHDMDILLVAVGEVDSKLIETLKFDLARAFKKKVWMGKGIPHPDYAFNKKRNQYLSTAILKAMMERKEYAIYEKILGIIDYDLYVPKLNFVFGEASQRVAIISLTRLRYEFYNLPKDQSLFRRRVLTEAVHELGHTYGVRHCGNPHCVMFFSNSLIDTDMKGPAFCQRCKSKLSNSL